MHLTDEMAERLLANAFEARDAQAMRRHIASCASCTERVRRRELDDAQVAQALRTLDHPVPIVGARAIVARASVRRWRPGRVAAGIVLAGFATAAVAMPGTPIARWWRDVPAATATSATPPAPAAAPASGITLVPEVAFDLTFEPQSAGEIRLSIRPQSEVSVSTTSGAVEYSVLPGGVEVRNRGSRASYEVRVPRDLRRLRVRVGGAIVFAKDRDAITTTGTRDAQGAWVVSLVPRAAAAR